MMARLTCDLIPPEKSIRTGDRKLVQASMNSGDRRGNGLVKLVVKDSMGHQ